MAELFPGGVISKTPPTVTGPTGGEGGSASGVWTLDTVLEYEKAGAWPKPVLPRAFYAWGSGGNGRLGLDDVANRSSPVQIGALVDWSISSAGGYHSLALKTNNTLWAWGANSGGQVGDGTNISRSSPVQVGALTNWSKVAAGTSQSLSIKTDGTLWVWGGNTRGEVGDGTVVNKSSPVQIGAATDWASVAAGGLQQIGSSFAIKTTGSIWAWGNNELGGLGIGTNTNRSSPVQIGALTNWASVAAGGGLSAATSALAVKTDGTLWAWGGDDRGQLGLNTAVLQSGRSSPVQVGALTNWSQVAGGNYSSFAIKTNATLWSWGYGATGRLGSTAVTSRSSPVQIGSLTDWNQISSNGGRAGAAARRTNGTIWAWGINDNGRIGDNSVVGRSSPVQIGALTTWNDISAGAAHTLAITRG